METKRKRANVVMSNSLTANGRRPKKLNEMKTKLNEHSCFVVVLFYTFVGREYGSEGFGMVVIKVDIIN